MKLNPFHLAIPVNDIKAARDFYVDVPGCTEGRKDASWIDLNLYGHQLVCHLAEGVEAASNPVDGQDVPIPHFGVVLDMPAWKILSARLKAKGVEFIIEPHIRFERQTASQATLFFRDPSGNALEFKGFEDIDAELFKTGELK